MYVNGDNQSASENTTTPESTLNSIAYQFARDSIASVWRKYIPTQNNLSDFGNEDLVWKRHIGLIQLIQVGDDIYSYLDL